MDANVYQGYIYYTVCIKSEAKLKAKQKKGRYRYRWKTGQDNESNLLMSRIAH